MKGIFINKTDQLRSGWKILFVYVLSFVSMIVLSLILGIAIAVTLLPKGQEVYLNALNNLMSNNWYIALSGSLSNFCTIFFCIFFWKLLDKKSIKEIGLINIRSGYKELIIGLVFGAISITIVCAILLATGSVSLENKLSSPNISISLISGLVLFITVGFGEEIFGRGYIMTVLKQTKSIPVILIVSALIFSILHGSNPNVTLLGLINIFLVGLLFGYMFLKSGNIWMPIGYHINWNYFQGYVWGFQVSGLQSNGMYQISMINENILNGGAFGPEGGLAVTLILLISFVVIYYFYKDKCLNNKFLIDK